ncbi:MAG: hypothetical protein Q7R50_01750 [Dehalococcoidales bacterium]|nr:hypothetical protein [Dehalococcoidales bacterium]
MILKNRDKDERTILVEKSSYALAFTIITYALLVDVIYRAIVLKQATWDLLGIVILGGLGASLYQIRYKIATRSWVKAIALSILAGLVVAVVLVTALR